MDTVHKASVALVLSVGVVAAGLLLLPGALRPALEVLVYLLGAAAALRGTQRRRARSEVGWRVLALALLAFAASSAAETAGMRGTAPALTRWAEMSLDVVGYVALLAAGVVALRAGRRPGDREGWIDAATLVLTAGLAAAAWTTDPERIETMEVEAVVGLPLLATVVLIVGARLALPGGAPSPSGTALLTAGVVALVGNAGKALAVEHLYPLLDALPPLAVAGVVVAAVHPSMSRLGEAPAPPQPLTTTGLVGLGATLLVAPVLVLWTAPPGTLGHLLAAGAGVLTVVALWKIARLAGEREHARAQVEGTERRLAALLQHCADVLAVVDGGGTIRYISPRAHQLLGHPPERLLGRPALALVHVEDRERLRWAVLDGDGGASRTDVRVRAADRRTRWVEATVSSYLDDPALDGYVVTLREITDRKQAEELLRERATTDPLTGLVNRGEFFERLSRAVGADAAARPAVLFIDLDDFKQVNDECGHTVGDEILAAVAARLRHSVRDVDTVARIGGDEFAILLTTEDGGDALGYARVVATRVLRETSQPLHVAGHDISITTSVGGALAHGGDSAEAVVQRADAAMYDVKRGGKDHYRVHASALSGRSSGPGGRRTG